MMPARSSCRLQRSPPSSAPTVSGQHIASNEIMATEEFALARTDGFT